MSDLAQIHILPEHIANQIAAGEVVQRPESVVKELVENAIDAGATAISIGVKDAGRQLIHIIDNGSGMSRADLQVCLQRHSTSKITTSSDLFDIRTLGFRGEALASIAAIADVEIRSRRINEDTGWVLTARPGMAPETKPIGMDTGTQIFVRNLFYNVPARRKFLKSDLTEFRYISESVQKLALSKPSVRITLTNDGVVVLDAKPTDLQTRISDVLAINAQQHLLAVSGTEAGVTVSGFIGMPSISRQSRSGQFFFLNGRSIVSRQLAHAIASAYEHLLDAGHHPVFVINIEVNPQHVDVNVHPQKHEVKFENERAVYLLVQKAATDALMSSSVVPAFVGNLSLASQPLQSIHLQHSPDGSQMLVNRFTGEILPTTSSGIPPVQSWSKQTTTQFPASVRQGYAQLFAQPDTTTTVQNTNVMVVGSQFIVVATHEGISVINQQPAHERVLYERVLARSASEPSAQSLLFAVRITLAPSRSLLLKEFLDEFQDIGFRLEIGADGTIDIHAVPSEVFAGNEERTLDSMLQTLEVAGRLPKEQRKERVAVAFAAQQSVKKSDKISQEEAVQLVHDLFQCSVAHLSPRGQATYINISNSELLTRLTQ